MENGKIDYGTISKFGILEICRQYIDNETGSMEPCKLCTNGQVKCTYSLTEKILRELQYSAENSEEVEIHFSKEIAEYILNEAQDHVASIQYNLGIKFRFFIVNERGPSYYQIFPAETQLWQEV